MAMFKSVNELCDVVSFVMVCLADNTIFVSTEGNDLWIPSAKVASECSWNVQVSKEIKEATCLDINPDRMLRLHKIWVPNHSLNFIYHAIFEVKCTTEQKRKNKPNSGKYRGRSRWITEPELTRLNSQESLRSPEILDFLNAVKGKPNSNSMTDFFVSGNFIELNESILITTNSHMYDQIIITANFSRELQILLLRHFLVLCFPALWMCKSLFTKFLLDVGWAKDDVVHVFHAADMTNNYALSFKEFLYILAATEPTTTHGGLSAEIRCRYIFRFFDQDNDSLLNCVEFKNMVTYMRKSKGQSLDNQSVNQDADVYYRSMGCPPEGRPLTIGEFLRAVGELKLRGTSQILRAPCSVKVYLDKIMGTLDKESVQTNIRSVSETFQKHRLDSGKVRKGGSHKKDYDIALHTIKMHRNGMLLNTEQIWHIETAISISTLKQAGSLENRKKASVEVFSQKSVANEVLRSLRSLQATNKTDRTGNFVWGTVDLTTFAQNVMSVCKSVQDILKEEPRLADLSSPIYIMDITNFEKFFWHLGPNLCPSSLLFLGDYVDRGPSGLEVIMYLFCYKVQAPDKLTLIRGNHEIREIQKMFTFYSECLLKFGEKVGTEVWNAINTAFDHMPLAATIDGKIFCCHGGIPPPWLCPVVSAINQIPVPLSQPDEQSSLAWEIMWNDPVRTKQMTDALSMELLANEGFANNQRRGTAHVFSVDALEKFLSSNGFSHLIRAHETAQAGFNIQQKGKLFTIFSSSKYCGGLNEAACILADQGKIRVLRLETL